MVQKKSFRFLRGVVRTFTHRMETIWEEPFDGQPAIFCPNHAGALGPIDMCAHFELRDSCIPWFNEAVRDSKQMVAYVRQDHWWKPESKLAGLYNVTLPYMAAAVLPPIIRTVPGIPVYHDMRIMSTLRESAEAIKRGEHLVIFPQMPSEFGKHTPELLNGWLRVCPIIWQRARVAVKLYPVVIDHQAHTITVHKPIAFDPEQKYSEQEKPILSYLGSIMNI